jgi:hypothetical protein
MRVKSKNYAGSQFRKAGEALDPTKRQQVYDDALVAAKDAFGDRYEIIENNGRIELGAKLDMPGLSPQQYAISQIMKADKVASGNEFNRSYNLEPDSINAALLAGAQFGIFGKPTIGKIISGGGAETGRWADKVVQEKFAQTGQEMGSGIDSITGGYLASDDYDMGHIYAGNNYAKKKSHPRNTRVESKHENRGYQNYEGDQLLDVTERRLYGGTAIKLGKQGSTLDQRQRIAAEARMRNGRINRAALDRAYSDLGTSKINKLQDMLALQSVLDRVPVEQQAQVMIDLGMATADQIL